VNFGLALRVAEQWDRTTTSLKLSVSRGDLNNGNRPFADGKHTHTHTLLWHLKNRGLREGQGGLRGWWGINNTSEFHVLLQHKLSQALSPPKWDNVAVLKHFFL
jgi:hypothetical protein